MEMQNLSEDSAEFKGAVSCRPILKIFLFRPIPALSILVHQHIIDIFTLILISNSTTNRFIGAMVNQKTNPALLMVQRDTMWNAITARAGLIQNAGYSPLGELRKF